MKQIKLNKITCQNFKGLTVIADFNGRNTNVLGPNGAGKTTLFDSFCWCLFGKNSKDEKDFAIKTCDETGVYIPHLQHVVTVELACNGKNTTFSREWKEEYSNDNTLTGHTTVLHVNGERIKTLTAYNNEVEAIIPQQTFKLLSNPETFQSLKSEEKKTVLLNLAGGDVTDDEVVRCNGSFAKLLESLNGETIERRKKAIQARKVEINKDIKELTPKIEALQTEIDKTKDINFSLLEKELAEKENLLKSADHNIAFNTSKNQQFLKAINDRDTYLTELEHEIKKREQEIENECTMYEAKMKANKEQLKAYLVGVENKIRINNGASRYCEDYKEKLQKKLQELEGATEDLRIEYKNICTKEFVFNENDMICPTCFRPLDVEDVEAKRQEMEKAFLSAIAEEKDINVKKGTKNKQSIEELTTAIKNTQDELNEHKKEYETLSKELLETTAKINELETIPATLDAAKIKGEDKTILSIKADLEDLQNTPLSSGEATNINELIEEKNILKENITELIQQLAKKTQIDELKQSIQNYIQQGKELNNLILSIEQEEDVITNFQKTKDKILQAKINSLFEVVQFNFVNEQLNGTEKLVVNCTINGVPYKDANLASQINGGLDIINVIAKKEEITLPIFIDRRESVTELIQSPCQIINLVVSTDAKLRIENY